MKTAYEILNTNKALISKMAEDWGLSQLKVYLPVIPAEKGVLPLLGETKANIDCENVGLFGKDLEIALRIKVNAIDSDSVEDYILNQMMEHAVDFHNLENLKDELESLNVDEIVNKTEKEKEEEQFAIYALQLVKRKRQAPSSTPQGFVSSLNEPVSKKKKIILEIDSSPTGYNVEINPCENNGALNKEEIETIIDTFQEKLSAINQFKVR